MSALDVNDRTRTWRFAGSLYPASPCTCSGGPHGGFPDSYGVGEAEPNDRQSTRKGESQAFTGQGSRGPAPMDVRFAPESGQIDRRLGKSPLCQKGESNRMSGWMPEARRCEYYRMIISLD